MASYFSECPLQTRETDYTSTYYILCIFYAYFFYTIVSQFSAREL